jgi:uncharacterized protein YbgA (DUF1722 family)
LSAQQRLILAAEVDDAEDRRALNHLDAYGLLPPSRDVEALLSELKKREIPSFSAFSYLADNIPDSEKAREIILSDPAKFSGVLVNTKQILSRVDENVTAPIKGPVEVSVSSLESGILGNDHFVVPPATAGAYNKAAASEEKELIQTRTQKRKQSQEEAQAQITEIQTLQRDLASFINEFGSGKLALLAQERDRLNDTKALLENRILEKERERNTNNQKISALEEDIETLQNSLEPLQNYISLLTRFLNEHEAEYPKNQQLAETLNGEIASLERWRSPKRTRVCS